MKLLKRKDMHVTPNSAADLNTTTGTLAYRNKTGHTNTYGSAELKDGVVFAFQ